jgi:phospholipid/cholesterol/gamma-HCH transport system substrate-binding protein
LKLSRETKTGIVVTVAILFLYFGFNFLKGKNIFYRQHTYYAVYDHIDGLEKSNPVQINGLKVGMVADAQLNPNNPNQIIVTLSINNTDLMIPDNSIARIVSSDLLGSKAIQLVLGNSKNYLSNKDTIQSDVQASLTEEVNKQVQPLKVKAEKLISSIDSLILVVQSILDEKATENISGSITKVYQSINNLEKTSFRLDSLVASEKQRLSDIFKNVESITNNFKNNNEKLNSILSNVNNISDSIAKSNITTAINNASKSLNDVAILLNKINEGKGSLGMLIHNDSLYVNLDRSARDLDSLLIDMKENPNRYVHFSVFGRKDKKKKKK